jgi:putative ABC transport system ATP-binding protein
MLNLKDIHRSYGQGGDQVHALAGVDIQIGAGEFVAIMGPSGSGKSTLLNILGLLDRPTRGTFHLGGHDVSTMDDDAASALRNSHIGFVFQSFHLLPRLSVLENVLLPLRYADNQTQDKSSRARELLSRMGLDDRLNHLPSELSGGQQQRVAICRALLLEPPLLLADEPTGNLDSKSAQNVMQLLLDLNHAGQTIVLVTHDAEVAAHSRRTIHLRDGRVV